MNKYTVIRRIIYLPGQFQKIGDVSIYSLLKESGYFELHNEINEADIIREIIVNPQCISQWMTWSDNKRSNEGWYFKQSKEGKYIVGYFPQKEGAKMREYSDINDACATFIKLELEDIRKMD